MSVKETNLFSFAVQSYLSYWNLENKFRGRMTEQNVVFKKYLFQDFEVRNKKVRV